MKPLLIYIVPLLLLLLFYGSMGLSFGDSVLFLIVSVFNIKVASVMIVLFESDEDKEFFRGEIDRVRDELKYLREDE